jgi:hypothetical protein
MKPTVGPLPKFSELEKATEFMDEAAILKEAAFQAAFYEAEARRETVVRVCGSKVYEEDESDAEDESEDEFAKAKGKRGKGSKRARAGKRGRGGKSSRARKEKRTKKEEEDEMDDFVPEESAELTRELSAYRVCIEKLSLSYKKCRRSGKKFYFDHWADVGAKAVLSYAQGGWCPDEIEKGDFSCQGPVVNGELMPPSSYTGRPGFVRV